ncbi:MAG: hypothetical protein PF487_06165 [Bacteroidales bacterium]|jgi:hypothetical protein|nr:hypothetical protein [Bacteroidales bacterium]
MSKKKTSPVKKVKPIKKTTFTIRKGSSKPNKPSNVRPIKSPPSAKPQPAKKPAKEKKEKE